MYATCSRCQKSVPAPTVGELILCIDCTARLDRLRAAASKGGKATAAKPGHMSRIGKRGFYGLCEKFGDNGQAVAYLQRFRGLPKLPASQQTHGLEWQNDQRTYNPEGN